MAVEKWKLFEEARDRWPRSFHIVPRDQPPGFSSEPCISRTYEAIEASCQPVGEWTATDEWVNLANWAFSQALWISAQQLVSAQKLHRDDVTFALFDKWMRKNLADESWATERLEYEESPLRYQ